MRLGLDTSVLLASVKRPGERFHEAALRLSERIQAQEHTAVTSSLALIELPAALAAFASMPIEKIFEVEASVQDGFRLEVVPYEDCVERAVELIFEFRGLMRKRSLRAAEFYHLAAALDRRCGIFVTTDRPRLLAAQCRQALQKYLKIVDPVEALEELP